MSTLQPNQFGPLVTPYSEAIKRDPLSLDDAGVQRYKGMARSAFGMAKEHRQRGDINSADEAMRFGAVYRDQARRGTTRGGSKTTWRYGDIKNTRRLP